VRLAVLVSGRGSNLEAVLRAVEDGQLPAIEPVLVLSNRRGVRALEIAAAHGVPSQVLVASHFPDLAARDAAIGAALTRAWVEVALLAGYDQWLRASYFAAYAGRTINIHPSLLPRHGGAGMIGPAVHAAVLAAGDAETGVTIHDVTADLDAGPILLQRRVAVRSGESAEQLAERVLKVEHQALVEVLSHLSARMTDLPRATTRPRR
jgi:phosphoribosylglycinamide formyltransferase-1